MASKQQLKNKIQAVSNIKQMTRAMQLVAATKMRKSQERALKGRLYAMHALSLLSRIIRGTRQEGTAGFWWQEKTEGKTCIVVVTSDKGLCGGFNSAILRKASRQIEEETQKGKTIEVVAVGKKARDFFKKSSQVRVAAEFFEFSDIVNLSDAMPLIKWIFNAYENGAYKEISFCSTIFISALAQKPLIHPLLPLDAEELDQIVENIVPQKGKYSELRTAEKTQTEAIQYLLEPSSREIMDELTKDLIEVEVLHLLLESNASEHSSRMIAMKNATDNAENIVETLVLDLNKLRQSSITQELTEISTAKEALTNE